MNMNIELKKIKGIVKTLIMNKFYEISQFEEEEEFKRNDKYSKLRKEMELIESKLMSKLSKEERDLLLKYSDLNYELRNIEEKYYFRKGVVTGIENKELLDFLEPAAVENILI